MEEPQSRIDAFAEFWARVKEHKVIQWALGYFAAALALAHAEELVAQAYAWPETVARVLIGVLIAGFPLAITLAWYHGHKGLRRISQGELAIIALLLLLGAGGFLLFVQHEPAHEQAVPIAAEDAARGTEANRETSSATTSLLTAREIPLSPASAKPRIAILPFENLSPDPDNAFFTDGMHEEIISALANSAPGLEVISRTTMMLYRAAPKPIAEIAKELGATHVLEGSVRREGDRVRLTLQLIDAESDGHIWSQNYDRQLVSAMTLQSEVAGEVAGQLKVRLAGGAAAAPAPTDDPVAYDLYLKARLARQNLNGASPESAWRDVEGLLDQALARDPDYVPALIERVNVNLWLFMVGHDMSGKPIASARADLDKAKQLAPDSPAVIGGEALWAYANLDLGKTVELVSEAEALGLNDPDLLIWKSAALDQSGRHGEARAIQDRLIALDPGNPYMVSILVFGPLTNHEPAEALRMMDLILARDPDSLFWRRARNFAVFRFTGNQDTLAAFLAPFEPFLDNPGPDSLAQITQFGWEVRHLLGLGYYDETRAVIDASGEKIERISLIDNMFAAIGVGAEPLANTRAWADLFLGDEASARQDGQAVRDYVDSQEVTKWNAWFLKVLAADAHLFVGERSQAIKAAREAIALATRSNNASNIAGAKYRAAATLAWAGAGDEATGLLEELSTSSPGLPPAAIARNHFFTVPLADNPRYQALKAKLEKQMAATKLE